MPILLVITTLHNQERGFNFIREKIGKWLQMKIMLAHNKNKPLANL